MHDAQVEIELLGELVDQPLGLGKQVLGVEQHDLNAGNGSSGNVHQNGVFEARRNHQRVGSELVGSPPNGVGGAVNTERVWDRYQ